MPPLAENDYDRVAYPVLAHPQTFPEALGVRGRLQGLPTALPGRCRVLELGCGDGFNLLAMAALYPDSNYLGIDYSEVAVERGRRRIEDLGLANVRLEAADIRSLGKLGLPVQGFDFIIAHGVFSWVAEDVREALFTVLARHLAPAGVAFVSYLTLPGAYLREAVRSVMRFHTTGISDPTEQVRQSLGLLNLVARGAEIPDAYSERMGHEFEHAGKRTEASLYHDELSSESAPLLFSDFIALARRHGLDYVSEAERVLPMGKALNREARDFLRPYAGERIELEQYLDFMEGRRFRQTLLRRREALLSSDADRLKGLWVSFAGKRVGGDDALTSGRSLDFAGLKESMLRASTPSTKALLRMLAGLRREAYPVERVFEEVRVQLTRAGLTPEPELEKELAEFLLRGLLPGLIELTFGPRRFSASVPEKPFAHPLARWAVRAGTPACLTYLEQPVEVKGALGRHLLTLLDGTRDRQALVRDMRAFLSEIQVAAKAAGRPMPPVAPDDPNLPTQVEQALLGLAGLGLLRRGEI